MSEEKKEVKDEQENTARSEAMAVLEMGGPDIASAPADGDDKAKGKKPKRSVPAGKNSRRPSSSTPHRYFPIARLSSFASIENLPFAVPRTVHGIIIP